MKWSIRFLTVNRGSVVFICSTFSGQSPLALLAKRYASSAQDLNRYCSWKVTGCGFHCCCSFKGFYSALISNSFLLTSKRNFEMCAIWKIKKHEARVLYYSVLKNKQSWNAYKYTAILTGTEAKPLVWEISRGISNCPFSQSFLLFLELYYFLQYNLYSTVFLFLLSIGLECIIRLNEW